MADTELYCTRCCEKTPHTHLAGRTFICGTNGCGAETRVKDAKAILAEMEERKRANQAAVAKRNGVESETITPPAEPKPASSETETPKEGTMKPRITDEKIAEIRADYAALTADQRTPAAREELASKHGVSMPTLRKYTKLMETKPAQGPKRGRKGGRVKASPAARPEGRAPKAGGLKAALQAMVDAAVEVKVNGMLDALDLDAKISAAVKAAFEEALK